MVVEVGPKKSDAHLLAYTRRGFPPTLEEISLYGQYDDVKCIEGCFLGFIFHGKLYHLPTINNTIKKAVYCSNCHSVRYLRLFKKVKV